MIPEVLRVIEELKVNILKGKSIDVDMLEHNFLPFARVFRSALKSGGALDPFLEETATMIVRLANDLVHNVRVGKGMGQLAEVLEYFDVLSTNLKADHVPRDILSIECELDLESLDRTTGRFKTVCTSQSGETVECADFDDYGNCVLADQPLDATQWPAQLRTATGLFSAAQRLLLVASDQLRSRLHQEFVVFRACDFTRLHAVEPMPGPNRASRAMRGVRIVTAHFTLARLGFENVTA
jgi:hypothetical protein